MAFNGTTHFPKQQLVEYMASVGLPVGSGRNARTNFDETLYNLRALT
jgi:zinc protease